MISFVSMAVFAANSADISFAKTDMSISVTVNKGNPLVVGKKYKARVSYYNIPAAERRVKWKSSNKKVAKVSQKGKIKVKKRGNATITAVLRSNKNVKAVYEVKIKTFVKSIVINEPYAVKLGKKKIVKAKVYPSNASDKSIKWTSSNKKVATVSSRGVIKAERNGSVLIRAIAKDGSKVRSSAKLYVYPYIPDSSSDFVAHRGLRHKAPENTATAFKLAGKKGFWGVECDVWETKPDKNGEFEIVLNHLSTFKEATGHKGKVRSYTAEAIRAMTVTGGKNASKYNESVCFLDTYLDICKQYDMVPVIEIKDKAISSAGAKKIADALYERGMLQSAWISSFGSARINKVIKVSKKYYNMAPKSSYLIYQKSSQAKVMKKINIAHKKAYTGVCISQKVHSKEAFKVAKKYKLAYGMGCFENTQSARDMMYYMIKTCKANFILTNGVPFAQ